ncbi:MAG: hypothetical protein Q8M92_05990, partial [Candidatus Subteraquimicrobiales bacterium]|nr:hypothetical protein [Candidatus Subteraquimicrobiales bacterium]
ELLYKLTQGDLRAFIGKLQDACIISNFNVSVNHIQSVSIDVQTAKAILEAALINYDQAREVMITVYTKVNSAKIILEKLYEATGLVIFANGMPDDEIIRRRIRERIAETDYRLTQGTNQLLQLDALLNYIKLIKFIPLQCPKAK